MKFPKKNIVFLGGRAVEKSEILKLFERSEFFKISSFFTAKTSVKKRRFFSWKFHIFLDFCGGDFGEVHERISGKSTKEFRESPHDY